MKFAVYQIKTISKLGLAARNAMSFDFAGHKIGGLASDAFEAGYYIHVCNIEAEDYDDVFEIGNIGPESSIERLTRMHSLSVGDVIVSEEGSMMVIAPFGCLAFGYNPKLAA